MSLDFQVVVCSEDHFPEARDRLINITSDSIRVSPEAVSAEDISRWTGSNLGLDKTLDEKLSRLPTLTSVPRREEFHTKVLKWFLEGESMLEALRNYPEVYEKVVTAKNHREDLLVLSGVSGSSAQLILKQAIADLNNDFIKEAKGLNHFSSEKMALGTVADWLLRCPLDFPSRDNING